MILALPCRSRTFTLSLPLTEDEIIAKLSEL
jgi:hypothetical protein